MEIRVTVTPGAWKEKMVRVDECTYTISVREEAERNMANMRVREIFSQIYVVPIGRVQIRTGHRAGNKIIHIG